MSNEWLERISSMSMGFSGTSAIAALIASGYCFFSENYSNCIGWSIVFVLFVISFCISYRFLYHGK